jgi:hypothetical protein
MRRARLIPLVVFALVEPAALGAQWQLSGEVGRSQIEQREQPAASALTAGATFDFAGERFLIRSSVLGAQMSDDRATGQWLTVGSIASPSWRSWSLQASGSFSAFGQTSLSATTSRDLLVGARTGSMARGLSLGGGLGTTIHNAVAIPNRHGLATAWYSVKSEQFNAGADLTRTRSVFGGSSILVDISRREANYLDLNAGWRHDNGAWSVAAAVGVRGRNGTFTSADEWQAFNATAWLVPNIALVFDAGRTLEDLVRGVPRTRYLSFGIRVAVRPHAALIRRRRAVPGPRIVVTRRAGELRRLEIENVTGTQVELMADFTDWNPISLAPIESGWRLEQAIPPGPHRVAIRIDGGEWIVPANLPRVDDGLGGMVGLITVP